MCRCLVTGHDFSRAANAAKINVGFSPCGTLLVPQAPTVRVHLVRPSKNDIHSPQIHAAILTPV